MMASMLAIINEGDEVIVFEPFYENYGPDAAVSGAVPRFVPLDDDNEIDEDALVSAFNGKTRALILNTPNNPCGKVFTKGELKLIADLCIDHDVIAVTDEIYEYILYDNHKHVSIGSLDGMMDRTITISGFSKTYSVTGSPTTSRCGAPGAASCCATARPDRWSSSPSTRASRRSTA
jgi:aminotransferase